MNLLYAVLTGFLMSACSRGILAISMQLYKKGASVPLVTVPQILLLAYAISAWTGSA